MPRHDESQEDMEMQTDQFIRVWAMVRRPDCPIDLTGLDESDRALVMARAQADRA